MMNGTVEKERCTCSSELSAIKQIGIARVMSKRRNYIALIMTLSGTADAAIEWMRAIKLLVKNILDTVSEKTPSEGRKRAITKFPKSWK